MPRGGLSFLISFRATSQCLGEAYFILLQEGRQTQKVRGREGGRKGERKESKCNLLFPVKRARLHPFILPEL